MCCSVLGSNFYVFLVNVSLFKVDVLLHTSNFTLLRIVDNYNVALVLKFCTNFTLICFLIFMY